MALRMTKVGAFDVGHIGSLAVWLVERI